MHEWTDSVCRQTPEQILKDNFQLYNVAEVPDNFYFPSKAGKMDRSLEMTISLLGIVTKINQHSDHLGVTCVGNNHQNYKIANCKINLIFFSFNLYILGKYWLHFIRNLSSFIMIEYKF